MPDDTPDSRRNRFVLDRRHFLMGTSAVVLARAADGCRPGGTPPPPAPGGGASPAAAVLAPPGSAGLVDEAYYTSRIDDFL